MDLPRKMTIVEFEIDLVGVQGIITYDAKNNELTTYSR